MAILGSCHFHFWFYSWRVYEGEMTLDQIQQLPIGVKIIDDRTGEELKYNGFDGIYVMGLDSRGNTIWLKSDRVFYSE